jgi:hypothetical protein
MRYELTRCVTKEERPFEKGEIVHDFTGATYGCVRRDVGVACSLDGGIPFFELPRDALRELPEQVASVGRDL